MSKPMIELATPHKYTTRELSKPDNDLQYRGGEENCSKYTDCVGMELLGCIQMIFEWCSTHYNYNLSMYHPRINYRALNEATRLLIEETD